MSLTWALVPLAAAAGWGAGWLSAWFTDRLQPAEDRKAIRGRSLLIKDPLVQASLAVIWAAIPVLILGDAVRWLEAGVLAVPLVQVGVTDLRTRYVYTIVALIGLVCGLAVGWQVHAVAWWWSVLGGAGGAAFFAMLYAIGRLAYHGGEPMARGDITIAGMIGAGAAACTLQALVLGVLLGGVLAAVIWITTRSRQVYMPYGPGLCLGGLLALFLPC